MSDLLESGLLRPGDEVYVRNHPNLRATVIDAQSLEYEGERWKYTDWGKRITGWSAINIYPQFVLARAGQTLDDLRDELRKSE